MGTNGTGIDSAAITINGNEFEKNGNKGARGEGRHGGPLPLRRRLCQGDCREFHDLHL